MTILGDVMSDDFNKSETKDFDKGDENPFIMAYQSGISEREACAKRVEVIKKSSALWLAERLGLFEKIKYAVANQIDDVKIPNWLSWKILESLKKISGVDYDWNGAVWNEENRQALPVSFGSSTLELKVNDVMKEVEDLIEQAGMDVTFKEGNDHRAMYIHIRRGEETSD